MEDEGLDSDPAEVTDLTGEILRACDPFFTGQILQDVVFAMLSATIDIILTETGCTEKEALDSLAEAIQDGQAKVL